MPRPRQQQIPLATQEATEKQSSNLNKEWIERYLSDCQTGSTLLPSENSGIVPRIKRKLVSVVKER